MISHLPSSASAGAQRARRSLASQAMHSHCVVHVCSVQLEGILSCLWPPCSSFNCHFAGAGGQLGASCTGGPSPAAMGD